MLLHKMPPVDKCKVVNLIVYVCVCVKVQMFPFIHDWKCFVNYIFYKEMFLSFTDWLSWAVKALICHSHDLHVT